MPLNVPDGTKCFVDATIFHYALIPTFDTSAECIKFLNRAIDGNVLGATSLQVLADVIHKAMMSEAAQVAGINRSGIVGYLNKHPELIQQLTKWPLAISRLSAIPLEIVNADLEALRDATQIAQSHALLTNDAMIVALMQRHGITHLATNDDDFDRVPGITVWKPRP
jgi:predicted nucleic acid-binding protein